MTDTIRPSRRQDAEIGSERRSVEARRLLTGLGSFVDDFAEAHMLHGVFVRSPYAHARVRRIDTGRALAVPGVHAVLTAAELIAVLDSIHFDSGIDGHQVPAFPALAADTVRFHGEPVAFVLGSDRAVAEDGAAAVHIVYEPLPHVLDVEDALAPGAPVLHTGAGGNAVYDDGPDAVTYGNVAAAFAAATRIVDRTVRQGRHGGVPMEGRGGIARWDAGRSQLHYRVTAQSAHSVRHHLAKFLRLPSTSVDVVIGDVGGAFGSKWSISREDFVVCAAARITRRPVKWTEDRREALMSAGSAREDIVHMQAALGAQDEVLGLRVHVVMNQGAYPTAGSMPAIAGLVRTTLPAALKIGAYGFRSTIVATNKSPYFTYRGPGAVETLARERLLDAIADQLGRDRVELRRALTVTAAEQPTRMVTGSRLERVTVAEALDRAVELAGLPAFRAAQDQARAAGRYPGVGFATSLQPNPAFPDWWKDLGMMNEPEPVRIAVGPDGLVTVTLSQAPSGQLHQTTMAQVCADELHVPFDDVRVRTGDSRTGPFFFFGTSGSGGAPMAAGAVAVAARRLRTQLAEVASRLLGGPADGVELTDGAFWLDGRPSGLDLAALAEQLHLHPDRAPATIFDLEVAESYRGGPGGWWSAAATCWVEVDPLTGVVDVQRLLVVHDCGRAINPAVVRGQIRGGVAQGVGGALYEEHAYRPDGTLGADSLHEYLLPGASDLPRIEVEELDRPEQIDLDFRGVGEGGAVIAPAAVVAAVEDALQPFGVRLDQLPLTPERIRMAITGGRHDYVRYPTP